MRTTTKARQPRTDSTAAAARPAAPAGRDRPAGAAGPGARDGSKPAGRGLSAQVCTSADEFGALEAEWDLLHGRCTAATPFQTHAWLHSWWRAYGARGAGRGLRVVLLRAAAPNAGAEGAQGAGRLVGAAAMMRVHRPFPALVPLGGAISDFSDVLLDDAYAQQAAPALAEALAGAAGSALVDFREVRPGAALERVYACWRGPRRTLPDSLCLELPAVPMDELVARLPSSRGQRVRSNLRKLAALGVERRVVAPEEVPAMLRALLALHRVQWQCRGRKVTGEHLRPRFAGHLEHAVRAMAARGAAAVTEFRLDGAVVAVDLTLLAPRLAGGYLFGADPRLRERKVDVATMLMHSGTLHLAELRDQRGSRDPAGGPGVLSLLRGDEPYKHHWRPERVVNRRLLLARGRSAALLTATAWDSAARSRAKALLRSRREGIGTAG
ncbi:glycosyl transferase family 1 [Streptomyces sulfonofaciens]|uniref:Glycosyl transferase family 1 n=1 Tax=Streptomyces sulfonofaciens TaxID=68272 RepID=A0A919KR56_9ACTN|nr:GNAT family N-acetyltransferase [Streptomyces sulfonofaciens]GHH69328.1 glycosyl transferase family 1 [Streptomyces sulfonofaciens]